jgi:phage tail tube protein FII
LDPLGGESAQFGGKAGEIGINLGHQRLAQDFPMLGLDRAAMSRRAPLEAVYEFVVEFTDMELAGHG